MWTTIEIPFQECRRLYYPETILRFHQIFLKKMLTSFTFSKPTGKYILSYTLKNLERTALIQHLLVYFNGLLRDILPVKV